MLPHHFLQVRRQDGRRIDRRVAQHLGTIPHPRINPNRRLLKRRVAGLVPGYLTGGQRRLHREQPFRKYLAVRHRVVGNLDSVLPFVETHIVANPDLRQHNADLSSDQLAGHS